MTTLRASLLLTLAALSLPYPASADTATTTNATLVANQDVAKAQAAGAISVFMKQGAVTCDENGANCHSLFGADDTPDYTTLMSTAQSTTGIQSFAFSEDGDSNGITAQTATLALACGDTSVHTQAGVAFKASSCIVSSGGDAQLTFQVCTAPSRGNPVTQPENAVYCSSNPADANYKPPAGKVCMRAACDTEPTNSLNGWSSPKTVTWKQADSADTNNGLGLIFYPALGGGVPANFTANSDNMTAVKIVQSFINNETNKTAVGLRIAYRHKSTITKEMLQNASAVTDPAAHTAQWNTITRLQSNAMMPQLQETFGGNASECLTQIQGGLTSDGKVSVCDKNYTNEAGIRPLALTAQMAAEGEDCATTEACIEEVVNTNTWEQTCRADVPLSMRNCTTTQLYTMNDIISQHVREREMCREVRTTAQYSCNTYSTVSCSADAPGSCSPGGLVQGSVSTTPWVNRVGGISRGVYPNFLVTPHPSIPGYHQLSFGTITPSGGEVNNYQFSGSFNSVFESTTCFTLTNPELLEVLMMDQVSYDDSLAVWFNDTLVFNSAMGGAYPTAGSTLDMRGETYTYCDDYGCREQTDYQPWNGFWYDWDLFDMSGYLSSINGINVTNKAVAGRNCVKIRVGVGRNGDAIVRMRAKSNCPATCTFTKHDDCTPYYTD